MSGLVWLALGAGMLVVGAELFAENVLSAARRVGLTAVALGVLLAGAEPEEAITAGIASAREHPQLAVGDAIGANLVVLTLALGVAGVFTVLPVSPRVREYAGAAAVAGLAALALLADGSVGRLEGGLLVVGYLLAVAWVWRREQRPPAVGEAAETEEDEDDASPTLLALVLVVVGVALMGGGGWFAVTGASRVVTALGLDDTGVGLTLLALATSVEMLALVLAAVRHRVGEVALAGLVGAVAYNATVSLGVGALVAPLRGVDEARLLAVAGVCVVLPLTLFALGRWKVVDRWGGAALALSYVLAVPLLLT
ncbi:MAG: sodium:calcium antiporter [Actinomycetota bacterium]|nr:sodium:calcium antiporter [Actinomycetota bacterium]